MTWRKCTPSVLMYRICDVTTKRPQITGIVMVTTAGGGGSLDYEEEI